MATRRIGLELAGEPSVREMIALAQQAEVVGCESVWVTETRFTRDAVTTAAAIATSTSRIKVGTAVINPFTRGAALIGVTVATLDELAAGRFILGIGPGSPTILKRQGYGFDNPLDRLREYVDAMRLLLAGGPVTFSGRTLRLHDAKLDFAPTRVRVPVYLGVTGPKALALAGEIADGVILNGFVSLDYTRRAIEVVRASAGAHGRSPESIDIAASIAVSVDEDGGRARDAVRPMIATYLAQFPNVARVSNVPPRELAEIRDAFEASGAIGAAPLVTDEMVADLACAGTPDECRVVLELRRGVGVDVPMLSVVHGDIIALLKDD